MDYKPSSSLFVPLVEAFDEISSCWSGIQMVGNSKKLKAGFGGKKYLKNS